MEIKLTHHFPCTPQAYWDATRHPDFEPIARERAEIDYTRLDAREEGARAYTRARVSPRKELPALVQKAIGQARLSYVQELEEDSATLTTRWKVIPDFLTEKVQCSGGSRVVPAAGGCDRIIEGTIDVSIPFIGGTIEKQIVEQISRSYDKAAEVLRTFIQDKAVST